jgi:hypothetical protein
MSFHIRADAAALTQAIDAFNAQYHQDYFAVRRHALSYLADPLSPQSAQALVPPLLAALTSWGAGKRVAPSCRAADAAVHALCDPALHASLRRLADSSPYLGVVDGKRCLLQGAPFATVQEFDRHLIAALGLLADALLEGNTNVTYPMKALLLITGLMPAYDSQVKGGLALAGVTGIDKTSYLLPRAECSDASKICVLPFHIAHCARQARATLDTAIANSRYPMLKGQYGRLFDILLFVQNGRPPDKALLGFSTNTPARNWYRI